MLHTEAGRALQRVWAAKVRCDYINFLLLIACIGTVSSVTVCLFEALRQEEKDKKQGGKIVEEEEGAL